jgi:hypothetical protein
MQNLDGVLVAEIDRLSPMLACFLQPRRNLIDRKHAAGVHVLGTGDGEHADGATNYCFHVGLLVGIRVLYAAGEPCCQAAFVPPVCDAGSNGGVCDLR